MDPDATLRLISEADTHEERDDACGDLCEWLRNGGFAPDWEANERATSIYDIWLDS